MKFSIQILIVLLLSVTMVPSVLLVPSASAQSERNNNNHQQSINESHSESQKTLSSNTLVWARTYDNSLDDNANSIIQTKDGGYLVAGSTGNPGDFGGQMWLLKLDKNGNVQWQEETNEPSYPHLGTFVVPAGVVQGNDGNYVVAGTKYVTDVACCFAWIMKMDAKGHPLWKGEMSLHEATSIQATSDNGYIVSGVTAISCRCDIFPSNGTLVKIDSNGNTVWSKQYASLVKTPEGFVIGTKINTVHQARDGGFVAGGYLNGAWILKTDQNGSIQWQKSLVGSGAVGQSAQIVSILDTSQTSLLSNQKSSHTNGFIALASQPNLSGIGYHSLILSLNSHGDLNWAKTYDDIAGHVMTSTRDGGFVVAGGNGIMKISSSGTVLWHRSYASPNSFNSLSTTKDSGYIAAGQAAGHVWVAKIDGNGRCCTNTIQNTPTPSAKVSMIGRVMNVTVVAANKNNCCTTPTLVPTTATVQVQFIMKTQESHDSQE